MLAVFTRNTNILIHIFTDRPNEPKSSGAQVLLTVAQSGSSFLYKKSKKNKIIIIISQYE
jgi:hypothetical protein